MGLHRAGISFQKMTRGYECHGAHVFIQRHNVYVLDASRNTVAIGDGRTLAHHVGKKRGLRVVVRTRGGQIGTVIEKQGENVRVIRNRLCRHIAHVHRGGVKDLSHHVLKGGIAIKNVFIDARVGRIGRGFGRGERCRKIDEVFLGVIKRLGHLVVPTTTTEQEKR